MKLQFLSFFNAIAVSLLLGIGPYFFNLPAANAAEDIYETDDSYNDATVIIINDDFPQQHTFHDAGDHDWNKFFAVSGEKYDLKISNVSAECDPVIEVYDTDGQTLLVGPLSWGFEGENEMLTLSFEKDGIYYLKVYDFMGIYGPNIGYDLQVDILVGSDAGTIEGLVTDTTGQPIDAAMIKTSGNISALSRSNGSYRMKHPPDTMIQISAEAYGYKKYEESISLDAAEVKMWNIEMAPVVDPSDVNNDKAIDLTDAILALQVVSGIVVESESIYKNADVSGDDRIGLEEVVFILWGVGQ